MEKRRSFRRHFTEVLTPQDRSGQILRNEGISMSDSPQPRQTLKQKFIVIGKKSVDELRGFQNRPTTFGPPERMRQIKRRVQSIRQQKRKGQVRINRTRKFQGTVQRQFAKSDIPDYQDNYQLADPEPAEIDVNAVSFDVQLPEPDLSGPSFDNFDLAEPDFGFGSERRRKRR